MTKGEHGLGNQVPEDGESGMSGLLKKTTRQGIKTVMISALDFNDKTWETYSNTD